MMKKLFMLSLVALVTSNVYGAVAGQLAPAQPIPSIITAIGPLKLNYHQSAGEVFDTILDDQRLRQQFIIQLDVLMKDNVTDKNINEYLYIHNNQAPRITYTGLKNDILQHIFAQQQTVQNACRTLLNIFEEALHMLYRKHSYWYGMSSMTTEAAIQIIQELKKISTMKRLYSREDSETMESRINEIQRWLPSHVRKYLDYGTKAASGAALLYGGQKATEWWNKSKNN